MPLRKQSIGVLMVSLLLTGAVRAQVSRGTITGIVTDPTGAAVPGVAITVTNIETGVINKVRTNESGMYTVPLLEGANYRLSAEKTGFKRYEQTGILVQSGGTARVDFSLSIGQPTQSVLVTGTASLLERDTSDTQTIVTSREIEELPLTSYGEQRNPADFMQLAPGVTGRGTAAPMNGDFANYTRTMTTEVSGSMVGSTTLMLDGADVTSGGGFEGDLRSFQVPPDAVGELKLMATNASAEFGRSAGGAASFQIKSGSNQIHGTAFEFLRNDVLDARYFFQPSVSPYRQNEFGAVAGGPVKKDKAFIFGWYDGFRWTQGVLAGEATVPTAQMLNGDFSQFLSLSQPNILYDPTTTMVVNNVTTRSTCGPVICNNVITNPSYFSTVALKINPYFPAPNVNQGSVFNNFISSAVNPTAVNQWGLRGDYNIDERNRLSVLYDYGQNTTPNIAAIAPPLGGGNQPSYNQTRNIRVNYNLNMRPNMANHAVLAYDYWGGGTRLVSPYGGRSDWVDYLGLKGFAPNFKTQFPVISIGGTGDFGSGGGESVVDSHSAEFADTLTWIKGKHTFKYGTEYLKTASNDVYPYGNAGTFDFSNTEVGILSDPASGVGFASYMLGLADGYQASHFTTPTYARNSYFAAFAQDDFKVTRKLTLNLGVRWDLFIPTVHKYYRKSWVNMTLANPGSPGVPGALEFASPADPSGVNTYYRNFSPRIGMAYSLNDKTVLRAAYGIFYAQGNASSMDGGLLTQGYNGTVGADSPDNGITPAFNWDTGTAIPYTPSLTPQTLIGQGLWTLDRTDGRAPYQNNVNVGIQRQFPGQVVLTVSYVENTGVHLPSRLMPTNQMPSQYLPLGANMINGAPSLFTSISDPTVQQIPVIAAMPVDPATGNHSPFPGFEALWAGSGNGTAGKALSLEPQYRRLISFWEGVATSSYNALQIKAEKRFSNGLTLLVSYAWSKTLTDGGAFSGLFASEFGANNVWNAKTQRSYGYEDIPNLASIAYIYDLPVGRGRKFLNHGGVANQIIGGWKISGVQAYQGGRPQNIEVPVTTGTLEGLAFNTPNQVSGVPMASAADRSGHFDPAVDSQFNNAAFAFPCEFCFGTLTPTEGRVRDFPYFDEDFSLIKEWQLHESWKLDFRADFVNAFNRVQFGDNAGGYASEPVFGYPGFGMLGNQENIPRVIQFGLRLKW
jgi:hypothetical protein